MTMLWDVRVLNVFYTFVIFTLVDVHVYTNLTVYIHLIVYIMEYVYIFYRV